MPISGKVKTCDMDKKQLVSKKRLVAFGFDSSFSGNFYLKIFDFLFEKGRGMKS